MESRKRRAVLQKVRRGLLIGLAAFALAMAAHWAGALRTLEWKSWDLRLSLWSDPGRADKDIVILLIDQYSLDFFEKEQGLPWPWPRQLYSAVVDYLKRGGARAVFFDLVLSESSRSGVEDDRDFAAAMTRAGNVFLALSLSRSEAGYEEPPVELLRRFGLRQGEPPPGIELPAARSASTPVLPLLEACRGAGNVLFEPDSDGVFRRLPVAFRYQGLVLPSIALALAGASGFTGGLSALPLDRDGRMILRYHGPAGTYRSYSIAALINSWARIEEGLEPQVRPEEFAGKTVLVGGSAPGLLELRPTPLSPVFPGVEIQATAFDNIMHRDAFRESGTLILIALVLVFAIFTAVAASLLQRVWQQVIFLLAALALPFAAARAAFASGVWVGLAAPETAVLLGFLGSALVNYTVEGRQRRFIKGVFSHYLSPQVIERIVEDPGRLKLGGEKREVTSFFSDVAGFTSISEKLSPEELVNFLNEYLSEMTEIILESGGTLDKYEGDAIIAFWNAPLDQPDHALRGCRAALLCQARLAELRPRFQALTGRPVAMRVGLNSGPAVVGNMGSSRRFDYTAMGDTINLASRLEGAGKQYRVSILAGRNTYEQVRSEILGREVDLIRVVGKAEPVAVYEIIAERAAAAAELLERLRLFNEARGLYLQRRWDEALRLFESLAGDPVAEVYVGRCLAMRKEPPPEGWDGVFTLKEK